MKLIDLLSELRTNILNDRSARSSGASDYLWTDETLVRYINEAQRRFAVRSLILRDSSTPEVVKVTLKTGQSEYALHPSIIAVLSAKLPDRQRDLARSGHGVLTGATTFTDTWDLVTTTPSCPQVFATDEQIVESDDGSTSAVSMRLYPAPSADFNNVVVSLRVVRKPIEDLVINNLTASPEIPADHHLEMLDWAAYLALRIVDHDAGDPRRAAEFAATFESHVQAARTMVMRKLFAPKPWGFGRGGWSWGA